MKKITHNSLTLLVTIISFSSLLQAFENPFKKQKKHHTQVVDFTPDAAFGDVQAQGKYEKKGKTATITDGDTTYSFNMITEDPNPSLIHNKLNLVSIGFFSDKMTRADMPITTHLFGLPTNDDAKKAVATRATQPQETENVQPQALLGSSKSSYAPINFTPSQEFQGANLVCHYFSSRKIATIHIPSEQNPQTYIFENVQEKSITPLSPKTNSLSDDSQFIGSYRSSSQCSKGTPKICSHAVRVINLYGTLQNNQ